MVGPEMLDDGTLAGQGWAPAALPEDYRRSGSGCTTSVTDVVAKKAENGQNDILSHAAAARAGVDQGRASWRARRGRRVVLLLAAVWLLNGFDLTFTLIANAHGRFLEMNPVAAVLLSGPALAVVIYKAALVAFGTAILLWVRRHSISELACWFLLATNVYVAVRWSLYFDYLWIADGG